MKAITINSRLRSRLTKASVEKAAREFLELGDVEFRRKYRLASARTYYLEYRGSFLPAKSIVSVAARNYSTGNFNSTNARDVLEDLGFKVRHEASPSRGRGPAGRVELRLSRIRQGQPKFRAALLAAYSRQCAVTRSGVSALLEAAHIDPWSDSESMETANGLLLRSDIHTLFDRGLLRIHPLTRRVSLSKELKKTEYWDLDQTPIAVPDKSRMRPTTESLRKRWGYRE